MPTTNFDVSDDQHQAIQNTLKGRIEVKELASKMDILFSDLNKNPQKVTEMDSNDTLNSLYSNPLKNIAPKSKLTVVTDERMRNRIITTTFPPPRKDSINDTDLPFRDIPPMPPAYGSAPTLSTRSKSPFAASSHLSADPLRKAYGARPILNYESKNSIASASSSTGFLAIDELLGAKRTSRYENVWPGMRRGSADAPRFSNDRDKKVASVASSETTSSSSSKNFPFGKVEQGKSTLVPEAIPYPSLLNPNDPLLRPAQPLKPGRMMEMLKVTSSNSDVNSNGYEERRSLDSNASSTNQFRRGSQMKILRESRVGLGIIQEQEDIDTLKRTLSWPGHRGSIVQQSETMDIAIFSTYLLKKNRRGKFQKRYFKNIYFLV
jgi:hypothetical protein